VSQGVGIGGRCQALRSRCAPTSCCRASTTSTTSCPGCCATLPVSRRGLSPLLEGSAPPAPTNTHPQTHTLPCASIHPRT
jgi:hypothetical protein